MLEEKPEEEAERTEYYMPFGKVPGTPPIRDDESIKRDIETGLFYDEIVRSYQVKIDVQNGFVTLSGTVGSDVERRKAEEDAAHVRGVSEVCNNLTVEPEK